MKTQTTLIATALIFTSILSSCRRDDRGICTRGNNDIVSETRNVDSFYGVRLEISGDVYVYQDSSAKTPEVVVEANSNLLDRIKTNVSGNTLIITDKRCISGNADITVYVTVADLKDLSINGSGNIYSKTYFDVSEMNFDINGSGNIYFDLDATDLNIDINGSGDVELTGNCTNSDYRVNGSGNIRCFEMVSEDCMATITGSGNIETYVNKSLDVQISGSGNVTYDGPVGTVNVNSTGSGNVSRK